MANWAAELGDALEAFREVATLGGEPLRAEDLEAEYLAAPHLPPARLPTGKMAIYAFWGDGCWLKVGKVGPNSGPRYTSQHYNPKSAPSTLARSIGYCARIPFRPDFDPDLPGNWIKSHCHRANVLLPVTSSSELLSCLEAFLHLRLRPRFER